MEGRAHQPQKKQQSNSESTKHPHNELSLQSFVHSYTFTFVLHNLFSITSIAFQKTTTESFVEDLNAKAGGKSQRERERGAHR